MEWLKIGSVGGDGLWNVTRYSRPVFVRRSACRFVNAQSSAIRIRSSSNYVELVLAASVVDHESI
jgi:hypothetical protein